MPCFVVFQMPLGDFGDLAGVGNELSIFVVVFVDLLGVTFCTEFEFFPVMFLSLVFLVGATDVNFPYN